MAFLLSLGPISRSRNFLAFFEAKMTKIVILDQKLIVANDYQQFLAHFEWFLKLFRISMYQEAWKTSGYDHQLKFEEQDIENMNKKKNKRKRYKNEFWINPPYTYSMIVETKELKYSKP